MAKVNPIDQARLCSLDMTELIHKAHPKVAVLAGAGASRALGLPIMSGFFEKWLGDEWRQEHLYSAITVREKVFDSLLRAAYPDPDNAVAYDLERVMMVIETLDKGLLGAEFDVMNPLVFLIAEYMHGSRRDYGGWRDEIRNRAEMSRALLAAVRSARDDIIKQFNVVFGEVKEPHKACELWEPTLSVLSDNSDTPVPLFTTNYDLVFEAVADASTGCGADLSTGFETDAKVARSTTWRPENYDVGRSFWLVKLHGSADCYVSRSTGLITRQSEGKAMFPTTEQGTAWIRWPVLSKDVPTDNECWFRPMYAALEATLATAETLIVIGFSFRDNVIRQYVADALANNPALRVVAVAPKEANDIEKAVNSGLLGFSSSVKRFTRLEQSFTADTAKTISGLIK